MAENSQNDKSEKPSQQKLRKSRERGQVARSKDWTTAVGNVLCVQMTAFLVPERLEDFRTRILRRNPLTLDKWGILNIPELGPIPLAGLTADEARQRLAAEPLLEDFIVRVTYLPVDPVGARAATFWS